MSRPRISRAFQPGNQFRSRETKLEPRSLAAPAIFRLPPSDPNSALDSVSASAFDQTDVETNSASESDSRSDTDANGYTLTVTAQTLSDIVDLVNPDPPAGFVGTDAVSMSAYITESGTTDSPFYTGFFQAGFGATGNRTYQLADNGLSPVKTTATVTERLEIDYFPPTDLNEIQLAGVNFTSTGFAFDSTTGQDPVPAFGTTVTVSYSTDPSIGEQTTIITATTPISNLPAINPATNGGGIPWNVQYTLAMGTTYGGDSNFQSTLSMSYSLSIS